MWARAHRKPIKSSRIILDYRTVNENYRVTVDIQSVSICDDNEHGWPSRLVREARRGVATFGPESRSDSDSLARDGIHVRAGTGLGVMGM
jgi:hypothetical protein